MIRRQFGSKPEKIFDAWVNPEHLARWFGPTEGTRFPSLEVNAEPGGRYRIHMQSPDGKEWVVGGEYRRVERPRFLEFTWAWEGADLGDSETLVTVELNEIETGTELVLTHSLFPTEEMCENHDKGWNGSFERLAKIV